MVVSTLGHDQIAARLLRRARDRREWTQAEFARRAGIPASQLCAYERSTKQPSAATLARLLQVAGMDLTVATPALERARQGAELVEVLGLVDAMPPRELRDRPMFGPFRAMIA
jgi:transcriptional regulator with XRE-family HTH domain